MKAMLLGWGNQDKLVQMIRPGEPIPNPVMLEDWQQYITVIEDEEAIEQLSPLRAYLENDLSLAANLQGKVVYIEYAKAIVQKEWERQGRQPLFRLTEEHKAFGRSQLESIGIPRDAWFVSLHVRDAGYKGGSHFAADEFDAYRNADIESYGLAIREVVRRDGYVERVGDPKMKPFVKMEVFSDYALSDIRSNLMDIFYSRDAAFLSEYHLALYLRWYCLACPS